MRELWVRGDLYRRRIDTLVTFDGTGDDGRGGNGDETEPAKPNEELLADLGEAIALVRAFLEERSASLDGIIGQTGFALKAANENDETRKRYEVMCRAVFSKFKACITIEGVNDCRGDFDAINIVYKSLQQDCEQVDITDIIRQTEAVFLHVFLAYPTVPARASSQKRQQVPIKQTL